MCGDCFASDAYVFHFFDDGAFVFLWDLEEAIFVVNIDCSDCFASDVAFACDRAHEVGDFYFMIFADVDVESHHSFFDFAFAAAASFTFALASIFSASFFFLVVAEVDVFFFVQLEIFFEHEGEKGFDIHKSFDVFDHIEVDVHIGRDFSSVDGFNIVVNDDVLNVFVAWDFFLFDGGFGVSFDVFEPIHFSSEHKAVRCSRASCTSCSPDAVHILFFIEWQVVVEHHINIVDV